MKVKDIALGGILTSLTIVCLYSTSLIPVNTISLLSLTSFFIAISILKSSYKLGFFIYISSLLMSFFLTPINIIIMYFLFFGLYPIVKYHIEKIHNLFLEFFFKFLFFNLCLIIAFSILVVFLGNITLTLPYSILWFLCQILFLIYDYLFTLIISLLLKKYGNFFQT